MDEFIKKWSKKFEKALVNAHSTFGEYESGVCDGIKEVLEDIDPKFKGILLKIERELGQKLFSGILK